MEQVSSTSYVHNLSENVTAIREFSTCFDAKFRHISNWEECAFSLEVPPDVIRACKIYFEYSPTLRIFEYLKITSPGMTVDDLKDVFTRNKRRARHDIKKMLEDCKELKGDSKIAEVITNSTTSSLLDQIAVMLDSATRPVCNWFDFGLELDIKRDILQHFKMYVNYNPTENLLRCVYTTSKESLKLGTLLGFLELMNRHDILEHEDVKAQSKQDTSTTDAKDVFKLGSKLLDEISRLLNKDIPGAQGWRGLAELFLKNNYIDDKNIISNLEPPKQHEINSPTTKTIEWLAANKPELTIGSLIEACKNINRGDAVQVLCKHFPTFSHTIPEEQDESASNLPLSIQETTERTEHVLQGNTRSFGLPESTPEIIGREEEIKSLVSELSSGDHQLFVFHGPTGIGKDTVAVAAAQQLVKHDCICVHVTSDGILSVDDLAVKILTTCGFTDPVSNQQEKVKMLFKTLPQRCVVILQNFDHMFHSSIEVPKPIEVSEGAPMEISAPCQTKACDTTSNSVPSSSSSTGTFSKFSNASSSSSNSTSNTSRQDRKRSLKKTVSEKMHSFFGHQIVSSSADEDDTPSSFLNSFLSYTQESSILPQWKHAVKDVTEKEKYRTFLEGLLRSAPNLTILISTWESFASTRVKTKRVSLEPLPPEESKRLLVTKCKSDLGIDLLSSIPEKKLNDVLEFCSGIPQLIQNAVEVFSNFGASGGAELLASSPLRHKLEIYSPDQLGIKSHVNYCLERCFYRLDESQQKVLVMVTVFPGSFTVKNVHAILQEKECELQIILNELKKFSFLSHYEDSYKMTPAAKSFAVGVATSNPFYAYQHADQSKAPSLKEELNFVYKKALSKFVLYTFHKISKIEDKFFSTCSKEAIEEYKEQEENLKEILNWCISGRLSSDCDLEQIKLFIIHSFVQSYVVNVKLMENHLVKTIICKFTQICQGSTIYNKELYIDCLIYGGATFILSCLCVPQLCVFAQAKAMWCFGKAMELTCESSQYTNFPLLDEQLNILYKCHGMSEGGRSQFLIKYGKCLVRQGRTQLGKEFIEKGIGLRNKKKALSVKDQVMLAEGFNDLAGALSYIGEYDTAIEQRNKHVLPVYEKHLGIHVFTASAHSHLSHDFLALTLFDEALKSCEIALSYRKLLLGHHSETARSLFDMGRIFREQACTCDDTNEKNSQFEEALRYFKLSLEMRRSLAYTPRETATTLLEITDVLRRLGRDKEANVYDEEIPGLMNSISSSHVKWDVTS